ncbi:MAG: hypothetical protein CMH57_12530 [Myxococcales bacterium]|nr:hypothetical protein [Myxococcales bacterium]
MRDDALQGEMARLRGLVDAALGRHLSERLEGADGPVPPRLAEAMGYAVLGGGKRMRPVLTLAACEALGAPAENALPVACALEMIHAYSLVHDDLPSMDDDAERRGRPTVHVRYGVATAILTGDALLTEAFRVVTWPDQPLAPDARVRLVALVAEAAGASGMDGGQEHDMRAEQEEPSLELLGSLHAMKTGALFRASALGGAIAASATEAQRAQLERYGRLIGRAFQVTDDLLDFIERRAAPDAQTTGDPHEDAVNLAVRLGEAACRDEAARLTAEARAIAASLGERGWLLDAIAALIEARRS